ncbi:hypothetical protein [Flavobacterium silvaticum]|uniref:Uncharacterized protein n=1 Tax=Flavobacterium silvaticum TaxID=1852020 RepID=A0A972JEU4_9FLAO|nr:hypothetical protein [Flavobacterium silvaticum]NMH26546.1 hypothetical protein [Flavobacterium silvaticum]
MRLKSLFLLYFLTSLDLVYGNSIVGSIKKCEVVDQNFGTQLIKLLHNGKVIRDKINSDYSGNFKIENIEKGIYSLEFENLFGQTVKKKIEVSHEVENIEICLGQIVDFPISTIFNSLRDKDVLTLKFSSSGCFHQTEDELVFSRIGSKYFVEKTKQNGKKLKKTISIEQLNYLIEFEKKLLLIDKVQTFCTTNDFYDFKVNGISVLKLSDGTCDWNGFSLIQEKLF